MTTEAYRIPTHPEIEHKVEDFLSILKAREFGLMTWQECRAKSAAELYEMLRRVLGKPSDVCDCGKKLSPGRCSICDNDE